MAKYFSLQRDQSIHTVKKILISRILKCTIQKSMYILVCTNISKLFDSL